MTVISSVENERKPSVHIRLMGYLISVYVWAESFIVKDFAALTSTEQREYLSKKWKCGCGGTCNSCMRLFDDIVESK